ncbi:hypothetical protein GCM10010124_25720 [Pilimelia terevasa]|uniref:Aerobactin siderophore biosynthesis IucA/IucC-like C-terminal domain-containing protein n=1 Tax=Pilimelia terevasa TaxID=53372 RepID=A0A8J3FJ11_9ACTN|nr:(2Fe-2S)-binding protein [Pilimelia terevasa]GGK31802.1 hypothetical protein GCM10010124_25720 [Pilimelia terevasa]
MHTVASRHAVPPARAGLPDPLAAVREVLAAAARTRAPLGLAPHLTVDEGHPGWVPATALADGTRIADLVETSRRRFDAAPAAAVALAWKSYGYWLALPAVLGWAYARQVPLMRPADVLVGLDTGELVPQVGLRRGTAVAVLPSDPLAVTAPDAVTVVADEAALLAALRDTLRTAHVDPVIGQLRRQVRISGRTLLGSLASGVAYGVLGAAEVLPGTIRDTLDALLGALGVADLVAVAQAPDGSWAVQRRTCCLAFTLPAPKVCSGCCLRPDLG